MFDISNIPDLKLFLLFDETATMAIGASRTFKYIIPQSKLVLLRKMHLTVTNITCSITAIRVDGVNVIAAANAADPALFLTLDKNFALVQTDQSLDSETLIPARSTIEVDVTKANAIGDVRVRWWALVHDDPDLEFQDFATISGGK